MYGMTWYGLGLLAGRGRAFLLVASLVGSALSASAQAPPISLLLNAVKGPIDNSRSTGSISWVGSVGDRLLFVAGGPKGTELYSWQDGPPKARPLIDISPFSSTFILRRIASCDDSLGRLNRACDPDAPWYQLFDNRSGALGRAWRTDGSVAGTYPLAPPGVLFGQPFAEGQVGFFDDGLHGLEPHYFVGQEVPPQRLVETRPGSDGAESGQVAILGDVALLFTPDGLWRTEGTPSTTRRLSVPASDDFVVLDNAPLPGRILFEVTTSLNTRELWVSDGSDAGTRRLMGSEDGVNQEQARSFDGRAYFAIVNAVGAQSYWISDGTLPGTTFLLVDGEGFGNLRWHGVVGPQGARRILATAEDSGSERLFSMPALGGSPVDLQGPLGIRPVSFQASAMGKDFVALAAIIGRVSPAYRLIVSDGSVAGTALVGNLDGFIPTRDSFAIAGAEVFAIGESQGSGASIYAYSYPQGTLRQVVASGPGTEFTTLRKLQAIPPGIVFSGRQPDFGDESWLIRTAGDRAEKFTEARLPRGSNPRGSEIPSGVAFMTSAIESETRSLWTTDGTLGGTRHLTDDGPMNLFGTIDEDRFVSVGSRILWTVGSSASDPSIRSWDSTTGGFGEISFPWDQLTRGRAIGDRWIAHRGDSGEMEPWTTDGTPEGTQQLVDGRPGPLGSITFQAQPLDQNRGLVFSGYFESGGWRTRIFVTDGHPAPSTGTRLLTEIPGRAGHFAIEAGDSVLVVRENDVGGIFDILRLDLNTGAIEPVFALTDRGKIGAFGYLTQVDGHTFFLANGDGGFLSGLWVSDGTSDGTAELAQLGGINSSWRYEGHTAAGAIFCSLERDKGSSVWRSDGTPDGTEVLLGRDSSFFGLSPFVAAGGSLFFTWADPGHGTEVWVTTGTVEGTRLHADVAPGPGSSEPKLLGAAHGRLLAAAEVGPTGRELWSITTLNLLTKGGRAVRAEPIPARQPSTEVAAPREGVDVPVADTESAVDEEWLGSAFEGLPVPAPLVRRPRHE